MIEKEPPDAVPAEYEQWASWDRPPDLTDADRARADARFEAELAAHLGFLDVEERALEEFGLEPVAEARRVVAPTTEDAAVAAQAALDQLEGVVRLADAHRIVALLTAYDLSLEDLSVRYGREIGSRTGLGAQTFFRSTGLQLKLHPVRVAHLVDTASTLRDRLPLTWAVFRAGGTTWRAVETAVAQAHGLDDQHWAAYDAAAADAVVSSTRLKDTLRKARERLQDDTASRRARAAAARRAVHLELLPDGQAALTLTGPAVDLIPLDHALTKAAVAAHGTDPERRGMGQLRFDIATDVLAGGLGQHANPACTCWSVPARTAVSVQLMLTVPALAWLGHTSEQATLAGYGPIDLDTARRLAGDATSFVRVLTDPVTGIRLTMDRTTRTPPADLKRWIRVRDQRCRFPGCTRPAHLCDLDHITEWHDRGVTAADNLVALDRTDHLAKTAGPYQQELRRDGTVSWTDPWGHVATDPPPDPADPAPTDLTPRPAEPDRSEPPPF